MTFRAVDIEIWNANSPLFRPLSFEVQNGQVFSIMGKSGIGKSKLVDAIGGVLEKPFLLKGEFVSDGQAVTHLPPAMRKFGILFQNLPLFPHLSVGQNIGFAMPRETENRQEKIAAMLNSAGLKGFENRDPASLSGGQAARVLLLRTLANQPRLLVLDEPFSKLDPQTREEMKAFVFSEVQASNIPAILITHDASDVPDEAVVLTS